MQLVIGADCGGIFLPVRHPDVLVGFEGLGVGCGQVDVETWTVS